LARYHAAAILTRLRASGLALVAKQETEDDVFTGLLKKGRRGGGSKDYVRFDEIEDVLTSTDLMALVAPLVKKKPSYWKWMIMTTHNALQGAMVCAYADSTGTSILDEKTGRKTLQWLQTPSKQRGREPKARMAEFGVLLKRCMTKGGHFGPALVLPLQQKKDIDRLHKEFRNNFAHFTPKGWSIEKEGLPRIMGAAIDATEGLMSHDQVMYRMSGNRLRRLKANLKAARAALGIEKALPQ
jgi:hypothetical protein